MKLTEQQFSYLWYDIIKVIQNGRNYTTVEDIEKTDKIMKIIEVLKTEVQK